MPILYSFHLLVKSSGDWWLRTQEDGEPEEEGEDIQMM
jgi:hypothetical protein